MNVAKDLREFGSIIKTYGAENFTIDREHEGGWAYFSAHSHREFHELEQAFDVLVGERGERHDENHQCVSSWKWKSWRISLAVFVDAPTGYEATA